MAKANLLNASDSGDRPSSAIRRGTLKVLAVQFVTLMGVATAMGFWPNGPDRWVAIAFLTACAIAVPVAMARLTGPLFREMRRLDEERVELAELYGQAREDSLLDALTGLGNHRAFQEELRRQLELAARQGSTLALILVDVDDLKKVNDEKGHAAGDQLLAAVGKITMNAIRRGDRAFRVGGDEFALLLPTADVETGLVVARRMLASALSNNYADGADPFSLSIGISAFPTPSLQGDLLYRHADAALYWCKRHGRHERRGLRPGSPWGRARRPIRGRPVGRHRDQSCTTARCGPSTSRSSR